MDLTRDTGAERSVGRRRQMPRSPTCPESAVACRVGARGGGGRRPRRGVRDVRGGRVAAAVLAARGVPAREAEGRDARSRSSGGAAAAEAAVGSALRRA